MTDKGHCAHGEFILIEGCPKCIEEGGEIDTKVNLCDTCNLQSEFPTCMEDNILFGDGRGNDNIIKCDNYEGEDIKPATKTTPKDGFAYLHEVETKRQDFRTPAPLNEEARAILTGGRDEMIRGTTETALVLRPGEDIEAQLREQIIAVMGARGRAAELRSRRDALLEDWNKTNQGLFDALTQAGAEVAEVEARLRESTLQAYAETGEKAPTPGVSIKLFQTMDYDPKEALKWAVAHQIALSLDKKSFETFAKSTPLEFVTLGEEPRAQIAQNLT